MTNAKLSDSQKALRALSLGMSLGLLTIIAYASQIGGREGFLVIMGVGILLAGASALVGGTLGFLFGIPRTLQQDGERTSTEPNRPVSASATGHIDYRANTNLEQISDWLTKILVGVGLTQINEIRGGLVSLSAFAAQGLGPAAQGQVFALALLLYSTVLGFFFGYLWTRLFLVGALRIADEASIGLLVAKIERASERAEATENKIDELKQQTERDALALNLAYRQLNPIPDSLPITQAELEAAISGASVPIKIQIFNQAWQIRSENWRDADKKVKMERTIPIFRALIRDDSKNQFHKNHGQLGFALKDKVEPEWESAQKELTIAIDMRGPWSEKGWVFYEFNRAICRIMTDPAYSNGQPSDSERRDGIVADLAAAAHSSDVMAIIKTEEVVNKWIRLNNVTLRSLRTA
jgi:hypothetical protein